MSKPNYYPGVGVIDLFCGAGGLTHGLRQSGLRVIAGIDNDANCKYAYETNNKPSKFIEQDITTISSEQIEDLYQKWKVRILVGCAPCQPFSKYSHAYIKAQKVQRHQKARDDNKWKLLEDFIRLIDTTHPEIVSMENVPDLQKHSIFKKFINCLKDNGYNISDEDKRVVFCPDYGVPQNRKRLVVLASLRGPIQLAPPDVNTNNVATVRDAIGHLEPINSGEISASDFLHRASKLSAINLKRIQNSRPGGTWRDWPSYLRARCHQTETGQSYPSVYGRMSWDQPSPTITTQFFGYGNGRFGHPEQDRGLSLREGALLQSFPEDYMFCAPDANVSFKVIGRMIGNAVPVKIGYVIGKSIIQHLKESS